VLQWSGTLGFILCAWAVFVGLYAGVSTMSHPGPIVKDRIAAAVVTSAAVLIGFALSTVIVSTFWKGWPALHHLNFYTKDMAGVGPGTDPLTKGGVYHAIIGTAIEVAIAVVISMPLGLGTAIFLSEVGGRGTAVVRTVVEAMTALPDILAGLFVYVLLIILLGWERTGLAAAIALSVTMTPVVARSAEVVLRVVPSGLREASLALGASKWRTVWRVVLPTARAGLATSLILGIARVAGETAPLLIVSGATTFTNHNPLHQPMNSLPLFIFSGVKSGQTLFVYRAYGAASLLLLLVLVLFVITRFLARSRDSR
jgi:phosphate transport system permease protein